jgi:aminoglycoside phosphotransferase (APT) family kinase protein
VTGRVPITIASQAGVTSSTVSTTPEKAAPLIEPFSRWLEARLRGEAEGLFEAFELASVELPPAGQSGTTVLFTVNWKVGGVPQSIDIVLRVQPGGHHIFHKPDIIREFAIMKGIAAASQVPVPSMLWKEPDPSVLGAPFIVMSRVRGTVPQGKPSIHLVGWLPTLQPSQRTMLYRNGIDALAALHRVDWRRSHAFLSREQKDKNDLKSHLERFEAWHRWAAKGRNYELIEAALDHLKAQAASIDEGEPVLVWGDARMGNVMFGDDFGVAAVLDWEVASIGPAGIDVGYWLMMDDFHSDANGVPRLPGVPDRAATLARYEEMLGHKVPDTEYFELLGAAQMAITLIRQSDSRVASGAIPADSRLAHENAFTQMIARRLGLPIPPLSAEFLAHRQIRKS